MSLKRDEGKKFNVVSSSCSPVLRNYSKFKVSDNLVKRPNDVNEIQKILIISPAADQVVVKSDREYRSENKIRPQISNKSGNSISKSPYNSENNKLPKVRKRRISEFHEKFEEKWTGCMGLTGNDKFLACLDLLDVIIQDDFLFGSYLLRIKKDLTNWKKNLDWEGERKFQSSGYGVIKQGVSVKRLVGKKKVSIKLVENCKKNLNITTQDTFNIKSSTNLEVKPINSGQIVVNSMKELEENYKALQQEYELLKVKQLKYDQLINALNNRGYPIEEIYENDVLNLPASPQPDYNIITPSINDLNLSSDDSFS